MALVIVLTGSFPDGAKANSFETREQAEAQNTYPESVNGLKNLLEDVFAAIKARNTAKSSVYMADFAIPNHADWFLKNFGPVEGPRLEARYKEREAQSLGQLKKQIESAFELDPGVIEVKSAAKPNETQSRLIRAVLAALVQPTTFYTATKSKGISDNSSYFLGNFVYTQGGFRYVDVDTLMALSTAPPGRIRVGGNVMRPRLVKEVKPEYPADVHAQKVNGTVVLRVVIGTDGKVQQAEVVSGHPLLLQAALDAVKQWVYQPTLLNGKPIEVETEVDVIFNH